MTWVKICGTTSAADASLAVEAGADAIGFIFAPSKRRIEPAFAMGIVALLPASVMKVGVFVNEPVAQLCEIARSVGLTAVQLHGDEDSAYVEQLRSEAGRAGMSLAVFKAIAVKNGFEDRVLALANGNLIQGVLFDSPPADGSAIRGGTGCSFDWNNLALVLPSLKGRVHVVVGGGLSLDNVSAAVEQLHPWGVDVCSGVESEPGRKHPEKVISFVRAVRAAGGDS